MTIGQRTVIPKKVPEGKEIDLESAPQKPMKPSREKNRL